MTTCKIQWIDDNGNPTPDCNPAVAMIRCNGYAYEGRPGTRSEVFPCCAAHLAQMPTDGVWVIVERLPGFGLKRYFEAWHNTGGNGAARAVYVRRYGKTSASVAVMPYRCMVDLWHDGQCIAGGLPAPTLRAAKAIGNRWLRVMRLFDAADRNARVFKWWTFGLYLNDRRAARMKAINRSASRTEITVSRMIGEA